MKEKAFLEDVEVLHQFMRNFFNHCNNETLQYEINKTQINVLATVAKYRENTMTQISEEVGLEKGSFTTVVDSLIEKGYLERVRSTKDRRKISLELTQQGNEIAEAIHRHRQCHMHKIFEQSDEATLKSVKEAIHVLAEFARNFRE